MKGSTEWQILFETTNAEQCMNKSVLEAVLYQPLHREYVLIFNPFGFFSRSSSSCSSTMVKSLKIVIFDSGIQSHVLSSHNEQFNWTSQC